MNRDRLTILVVDDEPAMREVLEMRLASWGFEVGLAGSAEEARRLVETSRPDAVISDVVLPDASGLELVRALRTGDENLPIVLITAYGTVDTAVEAMKQGAVDFLTKPLDYEKLRATLEEARRKIEGFTRSRRLEKALAEGSGLGSLVGASAPMRAVYETLRVVAESDASAIVTGESGTGKELAARTIHDLGRRSEASFIAVNTAAIPEGITESELFGHEKGAFTGALGTRPGYFELAHGGTLFLDEIAEMPPGLQPKLLRVLEDGRVRRVGGKRELLVDARVLAATNRDPEEALRQGKLRGDLYYRLSVFTIELPPLRERVDDLPLLCQHFVRQFNEKHAAQVVGVAAETLGRLRSYGWPGNVRELRNVLERAVILAREGWVETVHLPPFLRGTDRESETGVVLPPEVTVAEAERLLILETLKRVGNNKSKAARLLGIDVKTVRNKLKAYGLGSEVG